MSFIHNFLMTIRAWVGYTEFWAIVCVFCFIIQTILLFVE